MIRIIKTITVLLITTVVISGCVKDGLDECPEGNVRLHFFVEKFQNKSQNPLDARELNFYDRVTHLRYFLYKDNILKEQGVMDKFAKTSGASYDFDLQNLEYGNYKMVVVANCSKTALTGDPAVVENLLLTFPGCLDTEDYLTAVFPFTVNSNAVTDYDVGLLRAHGVIRYTFKNMPSDVSDIEVVMKNVSNQKWITGDYENACQANRKYTLIPLKKQASNEDYVIGTFPTLPGEQSAYYLNVYRNNESEPYVQHLVSDDLTVTRNQLLDIAVTFNDGGISFEISFNSDWDGSRPGGETELE